MRSTLHDPLLTAENRLWRAVLEQAYIDAELGCDFEDAREDIADGPPERLRARCYLRGDTKQDAASLALVCDFAEIPADRVLHWARKNYPRATNPQEADALAIALVGTRHCRARSCAEVSA